MADETRYGGSLRPPEGESLKRLRIGLVGFASVIMIVGPSSLILERTNQELSTDTSAAGEQLGSAEAAEPSPQPADPLVDLGVVPDIEPEESLADPADALPLDPTPDLPAENEGGQVAQPETQEDAEQ